MKNCLTLSVFAAILFMTGCSDTPPGGPGAADNNNANSKVATPEQTFRLDLPTTEQSIKQGEKKEFTLGIKRGKNFDQDVRIEFRELPAGLKATPSAGIFGKGQDKVNASMEAAADAALGHHTFNVVAIPQSGEQTIGVMKVEIKKP